MTDLRPLTHGVWLDTAPVSILGMRLTSTMTVLRLDDDRLLVHSPIALTPARRDAIAALGEVAHLYAPNLYHHLALGEWIAAFPSACVHAPPGLAKKRPDLRIDRTLDRPHELARELDELRVDGFRLDEHVLFHRASRTLVVADLVHNIGRPPGAWTKIYAGMMGFYDRVAISRMIRWAAFHDRVAARRSVDAILALPFERVVVGHGAPLLECAHERLTEALAFLPPRTTR